MQNNKAKLIFACKWYRQREKTWSGTAWSLYKGLQAYFDIEDFELKEGLLQKLGRKIRCDNNSGMEIELIRRNQKRFEEQYGEQKATVFSFSECPYTKNTTNYVYQDLSVSYLQYIKEQEPDVFAVSEYERINPATLLLRSRMQEKFYQECAGIFTMGQWLADYLVDQAGLPREKVHAVGGGINVDASKIDTSHKEGNKLLFVGRNFKRKGGQLVTEGFRILRDRYMPEAELYVLGPGENPYQSVEKGIHFVGDVPSEQISQYYNQCDVFCMPSYFEAYGLVFIEALCYGLPCIGRNRFAMKEFIEEDVTGKLIDDDDPEKMAEYMYQLLTDKKIRQNVETRREEYLRKYSWEQVVERIHNCIMKSNQ